ncbi:MAG: inorganic phosphate transporter [Candidatus Aureabacteria bacterium]|nr:inorganic phosphate transporter [Candidatus Auribacterota bacterium]
MIVRLILIAVVVFFAMNMGASGLAPSFAAPHGARLIAKSRALLLFGIFVILGAITLGSNVAVTLGKGLLPTGLLTADVALVILASSAISLFLANILGIPQSTSQVTVGAITGAGLYFRHLNCATLFFKILPLWILLPLLSYALTFALYRIIYPPSSGNLHLYQRVFTNEKALRITTLAAGCYVAFAIGSNNVANAVGPLYGAGIVRISTGLLAVAPLFGVGAWAMGTGPLETAGSEIVPLGLISSTLVCFVTASLLLVASMAGVPQSLVQLNIFSIFAVSCIKNGHRCTMNHQVTRKTLLIWALTPVLAVLISYLLLAVFKGRG